MYQTDSEKARHYLYQLIARQAPASALAWLDNTLARLSGENGNQFLYMAFGMAARQMDKSPLTLHSEDLQKADQLRPGFSPQHWTILKATRVLLVLTFLHERAEQYRKNLDTLFNAADVNELEALYAGLPLFPYPDEFVARCTEGIRTNMRNVLEAIVLDNPYPADYLDEAAWNQMVLKAVFNGLPLYRILGFAERRNGRLARMISDFAHERWAAGRTLSPEVWRAVGPFIDEKLIHDIEHLFAQADDTQHIVAALACAESSFPAAKALLTARPDLQEGIRNGELSWKTISEKLLSTS